MNHKAKEDCGAPLWHMGEGEEQLSEQDHEAQHNNQELRKRHLELALP